MHEGEEDKKKYRNRISTRNRFFQNKQAKHLCKQKWSAPRVTQRERERDREIIDQQCEKRKITLR